MLEKNIYKTLDALRLTFKASALCTILHIILSVIQAIMPAAAMALTTANFVDTATAILNGERVHNDIYLPLVLLLVVLGIITTMGAVTQLLGARISLNLQRKLNPAIVKINCALDFKHIENADSWELVSRVSREPHKAVMDGFGAFMNFMQVLLGVASILVLIVSQVWWAAITIIAFSTPMFWLSMRAGKKNYQAGRDAEKFNRRTEYLNEVLTGRDAVDERTLFGYGDEINKRWQKQYESGRILQLKVSAKMFFITKGSSLILALIAILIALTLISPVISGQLSAGMFMGIVAAVFGMINNLGWQLSGSLEGISKMSEYMKDLTEFIQLSSAKDALYEPDTEPIELKSLEFRNVSFKYPTGEHLILDGLSFALEEGKHYAFVGKNGAGKTTITKLLTGLYNEYEGEILVNGKELREYPASAIKAMFSVVYQDFAKYYIPLKDNIVLGDVASSYLDEKVDEVAESAGLEEMIAELKEGINTPLGKILEGGQDVSGGQWQRVAIARSIISRAPIKILDEPTAALDPISESKIYEEFEKLMSGKTTIFISHRLGSTKLADDILVIDGGEIIERGTHDELMVRDGQYAEMFEAQRGWYQ
ncbi:MAG: ABC transporter ATP-binding protein/permease [Oscillospiraceae bacterium]|jgi:ATP-binding cassette subfamily B protein|nr:ABC transporter ATP-binding protein/permease [Oscillospiraceae bacterium]